MIVMTSHGPRRLYQRLLRRCQLLKGWNIKDRSPKQAPLSSAICQWERAPDIILATPPRGVGNRRVMRISLAFGVLLLYTAMLIPSNCVAQDTSGPPPIPKPGTLARPRSLTQIGVPLAATRAAMPSDNPQTPAKIELGEKLFFDGRLSLDGTVACSTCHDPSRAFTDGRPASIGIKGRVGQRNAPTVLNTLYNKTQFWDGRVETLEQQAALPIINPVEMGQPNLDAAVAKIALIRDYDVRFRNVFGRPPNGPDLVRALAAYERTLVSFNSPFDHFMAGDQKAIDESAKRGWQLFN